MNANERPARTSCDSDVEGRVVTLLAGYLLTSGHLSWPCTDGLSAKDAVKGLYPAASVLGHVPDSTELAQRHPELAAAIEAFFL
jgi:hypothetical protein